MCPPRTRTLNLKSSDKKQDWPRSSGEAGAWGWCLPESFVQPWGTILCQKGRAQTRLMVPKICSLNSRPNPHVVDPALRVKGPRIHI